MRQLTVAIGDEHLAGSVFLRAGDGETGRNFAVGLSAEVLERLGNVRLLHRQRGLWAAAKLLAHGCLRAFVLG